MKLTIWIFHYCNHGMLWMNVIKLVLCLVVIPNQEVIDVNKLMKCIEEK